MNLTTLVGAAVLFPTLWRLAAIDCATFRLPDRLTLPLIAAGLVWSALAAGGIPWSAALGAGIGYGVFALIGWGFFRLRRIEGLGLGDAKLLAAGGAWTGAATLPWIVLVAAVGALLAVGLRGAPLPGERIAFGPWLATAIGLCWSAQALL